MRHNKLVSSMSTTLTAIFVALGLTLFNSYLVVKMILTGAMPWSFSIDLVLNLGVLAIDLLSVLLIVFCFIGRHKAGNGRGGKGLFVTIAILQVLLGLLMLGEGGYSTYELVKSDITHVVDIILLEASLLTFAWVFAGIAVFVAFVKTCVGMSGPKAERADTVQGVENYEVQPEPQPEPVQEVPQPEPERQAPPPPPPPVPPQPPTYTNPYE